MAEPRRAREALGHGFGVDLEGVEDAELEHVLRPASVTISLGAVIDRARREGGRQAARIVSSALLLETRAPWKP